MLMEKSWAQWYAPVIPVTVGSINRKITVQASLDKSQNQITRAKRVGGMDQVVEPLSSNCEALSSNLNTIIKKKEKKLMEN
jgi:hypothetical protein